MPWGGRTPENTQSAHYTHYYKTNKRTIVNLQEDLYTLTYLTQILFFFVKYCTNFMSPTLLVKSFCTP